MSCCFFSVVYPGVEPFLPAFFQSLENQTTKAFRLVLVNDGVAELDHFLERFDLGNVVVLEPGSSPSENRLIGIRYALDEAFNYLIFGDSDDLFSTNRVEVSVDRLKAGWDIVANELTVVDAEGKSVDAGYLSQRVKDGAGIDSSFIHDKNLLGLSNTAVCTSILEGVSIPDGLVAVDWYLFSKLLLKDCRAIFTNDACTCYRQHTTNTVGIGTIDPSTVIGHLDAKTRHYSAMQKICSLYNETELYEKTLNKLQSNPDLIPDYVDFLKRHAVKHPLWWENILPWERNDEMETDR